MSITKSIGEFTIYEEYTEEEIPSAVTIKVVIDYKKKCYSILPQSKNTFIFCNGIKKGAMWKAIAQCITQAVDFAEEELKK